MSNFDRAACCKITCAVQLNHWQYFIQVCNAIVTYAFGSASHLNYTIFSTVVYRTYIQAINVPLFMHNNINVAHQMCRAFFHTLITALNDLCKKCPKVLLSTAWDLSHVQCHRLNTDYNDKDFSFLLVSRHCSCPVECYHCTVKHFVT